MSLEDDLRALQNHGAEDKRCRGSEAREFGSEEYRELYDAALAEVREQEALQESAGYLVADYFVPSEPREQLRPPEEYAGEQGMHWLRLDNGETEVALWSPESMGGFSGGGCWGFLGTEIWEDPADAFDLGYRYLCPAVYVPPKW